MRTSKSFPVKPAVVAPSNADTAPFLAVVNILRELSGPRQPYAMLLLEVDHSGAVARLDEAGHERLMQQAALRARRVVGDCVVARIGPRRLVVLLEGPVDEIAAVTVTARLHQSLRMPFEIEHSGFFITTSIGIGLGEWNAHPAAVLRRSARALERVRANGGDATAVESRPSVSIQVRDDAA